MRKRIIGSELTDRKELELCIEILQGCMMRSGDDHNYIDLDILPTSTGVKITKLLAAKIKLFNKNSLASISKIVLIEKSSGPIGLLPYYASLMTQLGKHGPQILILRKKNVLRGKFAGGQNISADDNILIVDDVAMTGWTINEAAHVIWGFGATVIGALVLFDRSQGAGESLAGSGIDLFGIFSFDQILGSEKVTAAFLDSKLMIKRPDKTVSEFGAP